MRLIFVLLLAFSLPSFGKDKIKIILPIDSITQKIAFDTVLVIPNQTKEKLFGTLNQWIAINYRSAKDVIQLNDKENGIIIVKGTFPSVHTSGLSPSPGISHTMTIKIKDGKVKIKLDNMCTDYGAQYGTRELEGEILNNWSTTLSPKARIEVQYSLLKRVNESFQSIAEKLNTKDKDDW